MLRFPKITKKDISRHLQSHMLSRLGRTSTTCRRIRFWLAANARWTMLRGLCRNYTDLAPLVPPCPPERDPSGAGQTRCRMMSARCSPVITSAPGPGRRRWFTAGTPSRCPFGQAATSESAARLRLRGRRGSLLCTLLWGGSVARGCGRGSSTNNNLTCASFPTSKHLILFGPRHLTHTHTHQRSLKITPTILVILLFSCILAFREGDGRRSQMEFLIPNTSLGVI